MPLKQFLLTFALIGLAARAAEQGSTIVSLTKANPELRVSFEVSSEWSIEWSNERSSRTLARIYRPESKGRDAIVVAATKLGANNRDKTAEELFGPDFLGAFGDMLGASTRRRVKNEFWDGAYFEYELKGSPPGTKVEVHNWVTRANGYLLQFQCYFLHDLSVPMENWKRRDESLNQSYREILLTVQKESD